MTMSKLLCAGALALAFAGFTSASHAALVQWTLTDVRFADGGTASGSYVFDASTGSYSRIGIATTAPDGSAAGSFSSTCDGANCAEASPDPAQFIIFAPPDTSDMTGKQVLLIDLQSPMTDAGGTIPINPMAQPVLALRSKAFSTVCPDARCTIPGDLRLIESGEVVGQAYVPPAATPVAVPAMAPGGLALLSLLLATLAWLPKRRQR